jgi:hypothetical protein
MDVNEFVSLCMDALQRDEYEAAIGYAAGLRARPMEMFAVLNK